LSLEYEYPAPQSVVALRGISAFSEVLFRRLEHGRSLLCYRPKPLGERYQKSTR